MRGAVAVAFAAVVAAEYHDYRFCIPAGVPPGPNNSVQFFNPGLNIISLYACTATSPSNTTCAVGLPSTFACDIQLAPNSSQYVLVGGAVSALVVPYVSPQPFHTHALVSTPPVIVAWPQPSGEWTMPYPVPGATLCDSDPDCPVASTCNINGTWFQRNFTVADTHTHTHMLGHSADATYTILETTAGAPFTWSCESNSRHLCPGFTGAANGTGVLSSSGAGFTLTVNGGGTVDGFINNTFTCTAATLTLEPGLDVGLSSTASAPAVLNLDVTLASYMGSDAGQFVSTGIAIVSAPKSAPALIAVSGNGPATFGVAPITVLNATASSNASIVVLAVDTSAGPSSGGKVVSVIKVGDRIDHIRANAAGDVAIAGSFGVSVLGGLASGAVGVVWHDDLALVQPGTCGVCCSLAGNTNTTCRVDIGDDGVVVVNFATQDIVTGKYLWGAYTPSGTRFAQQQQTANGFDAIAVDAANSLLFVGWFYNSNTGKEPMVMPSVDAFKYTADGSSPLQLAYRDFPWDATVYRSPGPCDGDVADGRVMGLRIGRDGTLLWMGRSDGGDSPYQCGLRNASRVTPLTQIDGNTSPYNMQAQAITNMLRVDPAIGEVIVGQLQLVRLQSTQGNTLLTLGASSDDNGTLYLLQQAACCLPLQGNLTINGQALAGSVDATALHILNAGMSKRLHWTHFVAPNGSIGSGAPVDIDVRGGTVAFTYTTSGQSVTVAPLPGTHASSQAGVPVGYVVVLPTAAA